MVPAVGQLLNDLCVGFEQTLQEGDAPFTFFCKILVDVENLRVDSEYISSIGWTSATWKLNQPTRQLKGSRGLINMCQSDCSYTGVLHPYKSCGSLLCTAQATILLLDIWHGHTALSNALTLHVSTLGEASLVLHMYSFKRMDVHGAKRKANMRETSVCVVSCRVMIFALNLQEIVKTSMMIE